MWSGGRRGVLRVLAGVLAGEVVDPVLVERVGDDQGAQVQDVPGAVQPPAGPGDVHPVAHKVLTGALDHAGGDRPAPGQGGGIVQVIEVVVQVGGRGQDLLAFGAGAPEPVGPPADLDCDLVGVSFQHGTGLGDEPGPCLLYTSDAADEEDSVDL